MTLREYGALKTENHFGTARAKKILNASGLKQNSLPKVGYEICLHSCPDGKAWLANEAGSYRVWVWWNPGFQPECECKGEEDSE